jgi:ribosomal protein S21
MCAIDDMTDYERMLRRNITALKENIISEQGMLDSFENALKKFHKTEEENMFKKLKETEMTAEEQMYQNVVLALEKKRDSLDDHIKAYKRIIKKLHQERCLHIHPQLDLGDETTKYCPDCEKSLK